MCKLLVLWKAAVNIHNTYNVVLQKLLQAPIKKYLDSRSTVITKQDYSCYYISNPNGIT